MLFQPSRADEENGDGAGCILHRSNRPQIFRNGEIGGFILKFLFIRADNCGKSCWSFFTSFFFFIYNCVTFCTEHQRLEIESLIGYEGVSIRLQRQLLFAFKMPFVDI